jgi:hypothetical protein
MHRPLAALAVTALALGFASAASAQTLAKPRIAAAQPPAADTAPIPTIAEDRAAAAAMAATLTAMDQRIEADEVRMTQLRDAELVTSNTVVRAIRPALAFHDKGAR